MKKHLTNKQLKKLLIYISPEELKFQKEHWGKIPDTYWERVDMWHDFLIHYFPDYEIDHFILATILLEMQSFYNLYARIYNKKFITDPLVDKGATGLLKSLDFFNANVLNIETINIKVKNFHPLTNKYKPSTLKDLSTKDALIDNYIIEGKEVIIELFKLINSNRSIFQKISDREKKYEEKAPQVLIKDKPEIYLRKQLSPILYKYLKAHLPNYSHTKLCTIGGFLLFVMGIMPNTLSDLSNKKKYRDYLRKNFDRVLPPDFK